MLDIVSTLDILSKVLFFCLIVGWTMILIFVLVIKIAW